LISAGGIWVTGCLHFKAETTPKHSVEVKEGVVIIDPVPEQIK